MIVPFLVDAGLTFSFGVTGTMKEKILWWNDTEDRVEWNEMKMFSF